MSDRSKIVMNWSSGKDAALAFHLLQQSNSHIDTLLTTLSEEHGRVFMHGVREQLLDLQADRMNKPLIKIKLATSPDDGLYRQAMHIAFSQLRERGVTHSAFGDIFLEDLRAYREQQLSLAGIEGLFPLWKKDTRDLVHMVESAGIEAMIVCVSDRVLSKEFLGRKINAELINSLPAGVDPCGENGEFHTFVYNAPFFSSAIPVVTGELVHKTYDTADGNKWDTGFYFIDIHPV